MFRLLLIFLLIFATTTQICCVTLKLSQVYDIIRENTWNQTIPSTIKALPNTFLKYEFKSNKSKDINRTTKKRLKYNNADVKVSGIILCGNHLPEFQGKIIQLWDHNSILSDNLLKETKINANYNFSIYGYHFQITGMNPYLWLEHNCEASKHLIKDQIWIGKQRWHYDNVRLIFFIII